MFALIFWFFCIKAKERGYLISQVYQLSQKDKVFLPLLASAIGLSAHLALLLKLKLWFKRSTMAKARFTYISSVICFGVILLSMLTVDGQQSTVPFKKYQISNSGCQVSLPAPPQEVTVSLDVDSNKVYNTQLSVIVGKQECYYTVHILQLREEAADEDIFERLSQYLDYIKSTQNVISSSGYKKGNNLLKGKLSSSLSEEWTDHSGQEFSVMGWAKGRTMAVLFAFSKETLPAQAGVSQFLNSFQFPNGF